MILKYTIGHMMCNEILDIVIWSMIFSERVKINGSPITRINTERDEMTYIFRTWWNIPENRTTMLPETDSDY